MYLSLDTNRKHKSTATNLQQPQYAGHTMHLSLNVNRKCNIHLNWQSAASNLQQPQYAGHTVHLNLDADRKHIVYEP